jgi:hypothetical protein
MGGKLFPSGIVIQACVDRNIPECDSCGEAVGIESYRLKADGKWILSRPPGRLVADAEVGTIKPE